MPFGAPQHREDVATLARRGCPIPHQYRPWNVRGSGDTRRWCRVIGEADDLLTGFVFDVHRPWWAPFLSVIRVERYGRTLHENTASETGSIMRQLAALHRGAYQIQVGLFDEVPERTALFRRAILSLPRTVTAAPRSYTETVRLRLDGTQDALLAGLPGSTRRNIRELQKIGARIGRVEDPVYLPRLEELHGESFARTGSQAPHVDFTEIIAASGPTDDAALLGVFVPDRPAPSDLVAFVWGRHNGDHVTYDIGASKRSADLGRTPLSYGAIWQLICWARERDAEWFDFGGVVPADAETADRRRGITDFKLQFSTDRIAVGEELWIHPSAASVALVHVLDVARSVARRITARR